VNVLLKRCRYGVLGPKPHRRTGENPARNPQISLAFGPLVSYISDRVRTKISSSSLGKEGMAHTASAKKRIRQAQKRRLRNKHYKSMMKTYIKKVRLANDREAAEQALRKATSVIDKLVSKGIIHRNTAANKKARLTRYVNRTFAS